MGLIILEGLDRTGKTTVAKYYESLGAKYIHMSAPKSGITRDQYLQEMIDLISSAASQFIILDRSHWGELIWPSVYGREPLLLEEDFEILKELEESVTTTRILMHDPNVEAHWARCVANKEPLTKIQFSKARGLFMKMASANKFDIFTLPEFLAKNPDAKEFMNESATTVTINNETELTVALNPSKLEIPKTPEQLKLEKANAINDILSKKILKTKSPIYDELENDIRNFLNSKLGKLLGGSVDSELSLSKEEIKFYKAMYERAMKQ